MCASRVKVPEAAGRISSAPLSNSPATINTQQCLTGWFSKIYRDTDNRLKVWISFGVGESEDFKLSAFFILLCTVCNLCSMQHADALPKSRVKPYGQIISLSSLLKDEDVCD